jgi:predicted O-methyltransferase YrrM
MIDITHNLTYMPEGWTGHLVGSRETVTALKKIYQVRPFQSILEFGFNSGWSSALFLTLFPECMITSIEIYQNETAKEGVKVLAERFPERHSIVWADSTQLNAGNFTGVRYDTAFIDGGHDPDTVSADIKLSRLLGIRNFIFDDGNHPNVIPGIIQHRDLVQVSQNPYDIIRYKKDRYRRKGRTSSLDHYVIK